MSDKGAAYSFGFSGYGQLGHGNTTSQLTPKTIEGLRGVRVLAVAGGPYHSLAVSYSGVHVCSAHSAMVTAASSGTATSHTR